MMLEAITGDQAAYIFLSHLKLVSTVGTPDRVEALGATVGLEGGRGLEALRGLPYLRQLARSFAEFPYENISKIIKVSEAPRLEEALRLPTEVVTDHLERNFGGTCFSLTFLFERLLKAVGFDCYKVMADMHSGRNVHCLVVVREGGAKYIVDPGYALYEVMALPQGADGGGGAAERACVRARCPHAIVELEQASGPGGGPETYDLWTEDASGRKWRYRFVDAPASDSQFEGHWLESFGKPTLNNICLTRMTPRGHIYLRKDFFKFTSPTAVEKRRLAEGRERVIEEEFGIRGEWVEAAQRLLDEKRARAGKSRHKQAGRMESGQMQPRTTQAAEKQAGETVRRPIGG